MAAGAPPGARAPTGANAAQGAAGPPNSSVGERAGPIPKQPSPSANTFLGADVPPVAGDIALAVAALIAAMLMLAVLFADELGLGPRHRI